MKRRDLTPQAKRALAVYADLVQELGHPPSVREFAKAYGTQISSAQGILQTLRAHGHDVPTRYVRKPKSLGSRQQEWVNRIADGPIKAPTRAYLKREVQTLIRLGLVSVRDGMIDLTERGRKAVEL